MVQQLDLLKETPSQTAGPYVHIGLTPNFATIPSVYDADLGNSMLTEKTAGERITIQGRVIDGGGSPLRDALVEIWQADANGLYNSPAEMRGTADPHFTGWGRCPTDADTGVYSFETIKPGRAPFKDGRLMAPHVTFWIVARGINIGLHTRMYLGDEDKANAEDPLLARIEHPHRRATLIAARDGNVYTFDIHLQGERETVFLDI
ncbi:MAG TPA: protocatechuate 3,4-dioxygenase subunit alpha [Mesorhizobium sp.]